MAFIANMSGTTEFDSSLVEAYDKSFLLANEQANVMEQFAQVQTNIGAKSIQMTKYARLAPATTPLGEYDDVTRVKMSDSAIIFTPKEYGNAATTTNLAALQSGGKTALGVMQNMGQNAGVTLDQLAVNALTASANVIYAGSAGTEAGLTATDTVTASFLNRMYNQLERGNVPMINGAYVAVLHPDQIHDLREASGTGSWQDVTKYTDSMPALLNEVGMFKGFRIVRNSRITKADQSGAGTVDAYKGLFLGANALGKAESQALSIIVSSANDPLIRFVNVGWYGVLTYGIIDTDAVFVGVTASSVGANAA